MIALETFVNIVLAMMFWIFGFYGVYLSLKKNVYLKRFMALAFYFLAMSIFMGALFWRELSQAFEGITFASFVFPAATLFLSAGGYHIGRKFTKTPKKLKAKYQSEYFFLFDYRYLFIKSFDILFQQVGVTIIVILLMNIGAGSNEIISYFAVLFVSLHLPLLNTHKENFGFFYVIASLFAALVFPSIIMSYGDGFAFNYMIHMLFYVAVGFYLRKKYG